jgi:hypothetical protein
MDDCAARTTIALDVATLRFLSIKDVARAK